MNKPPRPPLKDLMHTMGGWYIRADGSIQVLTAIGWDAYEYDVTREELAELHPLLPYSFDMLSRETDPPSDVRCVLPKSINNTLRILQGKAVCIAQDEYPPVLISKLYDISFSKKSLSEVEVYGDYVTLVDSKVYGPVIPLVDTVRYTSTFVDRTHIESHYPGWESRWHAGASLGVENEALWAYVFKRSSHTHANTAEVTLEDVNLT